MKKIIGVSFVIAAFVYSACNFIPSPNQAGNPAPPAFDTTKRVALLEEWTGHTCTWCTDAARITEQIEDTYGDRFISISIHDGFFAEPCTQANVPSCAQNVPGAFAEDFQCATGASYSSSHVGANGMPPVGMVNRLGMQSGTEIMQRSAWSSKVDSLVQTDACSSMHIDLEYFIPTRQLQVSCWGKWLQSYTGDIRIAIMLTESGMVGWQKDGPQGCDPQWEFKNVLRECLNTPGNIAGSPLYNGATPVGTTWTYSLPGFYTIPNNFVDTNCKVVALIYDATTGEVLQAWEEKIQ